MAELDPSIILAAGTLNDPTKLITLKDMALKLKQEQNAVQGQNALRKLFSDPSNIDPTGNLTPQAQAKVMAIDPATGMAFRKQQLEEQVKQMEAQHDKSLIGGMKFDLYGSAAAAGVDAYEAAKKAGKSDQDAVTAATDARNGVVRSSGGVLSKEDVDRVVGSPFVLDQAQALASTDKDWMTARHQQAADVRADARLAEQEKRDDAMIAAATRKEPQNTGADIETLTDSKGVTYDHNKVTHKNYRSDTGEEYTPVGSESKIGSGGQPRSGSALAVRKYMEEHPDATAADIQRFVATGNALSSSARAWATGQQGNTVRSLDVAVSHIDVLNDLVGALDNGDIKLLNAAKNRFESETGGTAPGNFTAAKGVVGDEIVKAVLGSGAGSDRDRQELQANFDAAKSPEQLRGVIQTAERLMGGQLSGLRQQYKRTTGNDDFDDAFLSERTKKVLGPLSGEGDGKPSSDDGWGVKRVN